VNEHPLIAISSSLSIIPLITVPFADDEIESNDTFSNNPEPN
jgi:hypothetical protein